MGFVQDRLVTGWKLSILSRKTLATLRSDFASGLSLQVEGDFALAELRANTAITLVYLARCPEAAPLQQPEN